MGRLRLPPCSAKKCGLITKGFTRRLSARRIYPNFLSKLPNCQLKKYPPNNKSNPIFNPLHFHRLPRLQRPLRRPHHHQRPQPFLQRTPRLDISRNEVDKMRQLQIKRRRRLIRHLQPLTLQLLRPALRRPPVVAPPRHVRHAQRRLGAKDAVEVPPRPRHGRVLARPGLEAMRRRAGVAHEERAHRAAGEAEGQRGALVGGVRRVGALGRRLLGVDAHHGAEEVLQAVDVVDEVDGEDAAGGGGAAPGRGGEVGVGFEERPEAVDGDDGAQGPGVEDGFCRRDVGVEAAVVAGEDLEV